MKIIEVRSLCSKLLFYRFSTLEKMVGKKGFEPPTPSSRTTCATRLLHFPLLIGSVNAKIDGVDEGGFFWSVFENPHCITGDCTIVTGAFDGIF